MPPVRIHRAHYHKPVVISGFEPLDLLEGILMVLRQLRAERRESRISIAASCPGNGNLAALRALGDVFELRPYFEWRGLGFISQSALKIQTTRFGSGTPRRSFEMPGIRVTDPKAAQCGEVLKGVLKPPQCKLFGNECTPEHPIGALMVSSEGACAAYYQYVRTAGG